VRQRLTELCIDYVAHQVPVEREGRVLLRERTGGDTIPVLVNLDGQMLVGEDAIDAHLDGVSEPAEAHAHRTKAEKARRRYLEEECECSQLPSQSAPRQTTRSQAPSSASARS
jgi:hypothetical protein